MYLDRVRFHLPKVAHALGRKLSLGDRKYRAHGYHADRFAYEQNDEPHLMPVIRRSLRDRRGVFLDVGANCGQTLNKVLSIEPDREYLAFEPQIECCFAIERFKKKNGLSNIAVLPIALSTTDGVNQLFFDNPIDVTASLSSTHFDDRQKLRSHSAWIVVRQGDTLLRELNVADIAVIKIDVEGHELDVLKGLTHTIQKHRPVLIFEILTNRTWGTLIEDENLRREKQKNADEIFDLLHELRYLTYRIDSQGNELRVRRVDLDEELAPEFSNDGRDYVARFE